MKIISHRGNLTGPNPELENKPEYIEAAIKAGFDVEVDLWGDRHNPNFMGHGILALGHDAPTHEVSIGWVKKYCRDIFFHCKDAQAENFLQWFGGPCFWFVHSGLPRVSGVGGQTWHYPGATLQGPMPIACLPETVPDWDISGAWGICTDYPVKYREMYK